MTTLPLKVSAFEAWRRWDARAIEAACEGEEVRLPADAPAQADCAFWRAMVCFMRESSEALTHLEGAWRGHDLGACSAQAQLDVDTALSLCLLDVGAMNDMARWLARATSLSADSADLLSAFWTGLGRLARVILGQGGSADDVAQTLRAQLMPLAKQRTPDERLMLAQMLVNYYFHTGKFEQFEWLCSAAEEATHFAAASALSRARWLYTIGFARYQIGEHERAEDAWKRATQLAQDHALDGVGLLAILALVRLMVDQGRRDEAASTLGAIRPHWGAGRTAQLIQLQQMRARVLLLEEQPTRALATIYEALSLAEAAGLSLSEIASAHTDLAQCLIAAGRGDEAHALLLRFAREHEGRNGQVFRCLANLWAALATTPAESDGGLRDGLVQARELRYPMFFRLLPRVAARVCALALERNVERVFIEEVVRQRALPAPAEAGMHWPWQVRVRMLGGFDVKGTAFEAAGGGKTARKPLELLRLLACSDSLALPAYTVMDALWPDAEGDASRKSLEMAVLRLRRLLGDPTLIIVADGRVGLDGSRLTSDVVVRRRAVDRLVAHSVASERAADSAGGWIALVRSVLNTARLELLPGAPDAPWLEAERARVRRETVRAVLAAAALAEVEAVSSNQQVVWLEAAMEVDPASQAVAHGLMRAYERSGLAAEALRVFDRVTDTLALQRAKPGHELVALARTLRDNAPR